jgi:hypothetical protein
LGEYYGLIIISLITSTAQISVFQPPKNATTTNSPQNVSVPTGSNGVENTIENSKDSKEREISLELGSIQDNV